MTLEQLQETWRRIANNARDSRYIREIEEERWCDFLAGEKWTSKQLMEMENGQVKNIPKVRKSP